MHYPNGHSERWEIFDTDRLVRAKREGAGSNQGKEMTFVVSKDPEAYKQQCHLPHELGAAELLPPLDRTAYIGGDQV